MLLECFNYSLPGKGRESSEGTVFQFQHKDQGGVATAGSRGTVQEDSSKDVALCLVEFAPLKKMTKQISKWQQEFRWS